MMEMVDKKLVMSKVIGIVIKLCLAVDFGFSSEAAEKSFAINTAISNMVTSIIKG